MNAAAHLFDSHCHLDDAAFDPDRETLIQGLPAWGIYACLTCGSDLSSSRAARDLSRRYPFVWGAAGIHPHESGKTVESDFPALKDLLRDPKIRAVGEIGLDFHYDYSPQDVQKAVLVRQIDLALEMGKPVVLHVREAHGAMIELLRAREGILPGGVLHCFSGSAESAREYQELGFHISFAGSITFRNAAKWRSAALAVKPDRLLIETDSPYLAPEPARGQRNDPSRVSQVCRVLAEILGISYEKMARVTLENACALFGVPLPEDAAWG